VSFSLADARDVGVSTRQNARSRQYRDVPLSSHCIRYPFNALKCTLATSLLSAVLPGFFEPEPPGLPDPDVAAFSRPDDCPKPDIGCGCRDGENADPPY
jgi:hypothetical protein